MKINDIPLNGNYEGYYWLSDSTRPCVLVNEPLTEEFLNENPFVVEAELWDKATGTSYSVHNAGNNVICNKYDVAAEDINRLKNGDTCKTDNYCIDEVDYIAQRMTDKNGKNYGIMKFLEYWELRNDSGEEAEENQPCLGMKSLQLTKRVFIGFKEKED